MMRELAVKVRNRSVLISTAVTLVLIVGGLVASSLLSGTDSGSEHEIAAVGAGSVEMVEAVDDSLSDDDSASPREATRQEAEQLLDDGDVDAALVHEDGSWVLLGDGSLDPVLEQAVTQSVSSATIAANAASAGTSMDQLAQGSEVRVEQIGEGSDSRDTAASFVLRYVFAMLFYMAAIMFGTAIANSVLEEKQNRVVEILATAIPVLSLIHI